MEKQLSEKLIDMGIMPNLSGFHYLKDAIRLVLSDKSYLLNMTKGLYPKIAKTYDTTASKVERAIRHAVGKTDEPLTNGQFIGILAERMKLEQ